MYVCVQSSQEEGDKSVSKCDNSNNLKYSAEVGSIISTFNQSSNEVGKKVTNIHQIMLKSIDLLIKQ
jgi:hypothetical protein